jgi:hypothetical protein
LKSEFQLLLALSNYLDYNLIILIN